MWDAGIYVGYKPDVSKGYVKGGQNKLILCKVLRGESKPLLAPGSGSAQLGHYAATAEFCVIFQSQQILPFAVITYS